ncbi:MAG: aspartate aminotransferase family protein [Kordiimonadaceae bacterium]|jgi:glutamate/tyrosine decarboxylase-like PLP-dependent enzyme|nr:aspartate aminotransferase family protein [Kordiimonadaceae bacterium]MBT6034841.1 aspartate aminotransferase family protein [Kordiimonadaceae bacterium]MBT6328903.1 aspartate aminotransferase family protein [Kordiimonadaceae bacterium]
MEFDQELYDYVLNAAKSFESSLDSRPVTPSDEVIKALDYFDEPLSNGGIEATQVIKMLHEVGEPGVVSSRGGRFYGFVTGGALPVAVAANWMAASWDQNGGPSVMSPISSKLEQVAGSWVLDALDLPASSTFGFVTGATMAGFTALSSARTKIYQNCGYDLKADGIRNAPKIRFVMSEEIHPTNIIALQYMGFGKNELEFVKCDEQGRIIPEEMPPLDDHTIVILQAGNVNSGSFDHFNEVCDLAEGTGAWVHVDAAFGGWVRASENYKHLANGMERADSWSLDCHKWLNVPHDSAIAICRDSNVMQDTFGVRASYLVPGSLREGYHFTPELSRRARGMEIWAALKYLGKDGLAEIIDRTCGFAKYCAKELENQGFEILNDVVINQIVATMKDEDKVDDFIKSVQQDGKTWFGPTDWKGRKAFRISISSHATTKEDIDISLKSIQENMP